MKASAWTANPLRLLAEKRPRASEHPRTTYFLPPPLRLLSPLYIHMRFSLYCRVPPSARFLPHLPLLTFALLAVARSRETADSPPNSPTRRRSQKIKMKRKKTVARVIQKLERWARSAIKRWENHL
eukprot:scaffold5391_cov29-Tisochrysis_lutea.AAC.9